MPRPDDKTPAAPPCPGRHGLHWAAFLAAVFTWPLLLVGGSVTVYRVGMAVPDWPTTFGVNMFLYNFLNSPWGVFLEHSHRLYGAAVGLACIVLAFGATLPRGLWSGLGVCATALAVPAVALAANKLAGWGLSPFLLGTASLGLLSLLLAAWFAIVRRAPLAALTWFALAAVVGQGVLGGYRVRLNSTDLALLHGVTAQAFFALMIVLCVVTGRGWTSPAREVTDAARLRYHAGAVLALILAQIGLGAWLRHHGSPDALLVHAGASVVVTLAALFTAGSVLHRRDTLPDLAPSARALALAVLAQILLGVTAWYLLRPFDGIARPVWPAQALVRIAHQGVAALLLAAAVVLTLRSFRHLHPSRHNRSSEPTNPHSVPAPRDLEAVA